MKTPASRKQARLSGGRTLAAAMLALAPVIAFAQSPGSGQSAADHCDGRYEPRETCLREAAAARAEQRRGTLRDVPGDTASVYQQNALRRCDALPAADRNACHARVRGGDGATVSGSVQGGGLFREYREIVPAAPVQPVAPAAVPLAPTPGYAPTPLPPPQPGYAPAPLSPAQPGYAPPQSYERPLGTGAAPGLRPSGIAPIPPAPSGSAVR